MTVELFNDAAIDHVIIALQMRANYVETNDMSMSLNDLNAQNAAAQRAGRIWTRPPRPSAEQLQLAAWLRDLATRIRTNPTFTSAEFP